MIMKAATKPLWGMTEDELLDGDLTLARCSRCSGRGVYQEQELDFDGGDLRMIERSVPCDCRRLPARLLQEANLPAGRFDGLTLADLEWEYVEPSEAVTAVRNFAVHLKVWLAEGMGLTLMGSVGTGKTHIAVGLVKLACGLGIESRFLTMTELLGAIKATYGRDRMGSPRRGSETPDEAGLLDELAGVPLLVLDDLGTENPTPWARERLYTLVNRRYLGQRPVIVTTNLTLEELARRLGERTVSRLWGTSLVINLRGRDYRERARRQTLSRIRSHTSELHVLSREA